MGSLGLGGCVARHACVKTEPAKASFCRILGGLCEAFTINGILGATSNSKDTMCCVLISALAPPAPFETSFLAMNQK